METQTASDPLDVLFVKGTSARETAKFLLNYLRINPNTLRVLFLSDELTVKKQILLYFLALRVMYATDRRINDSATSKEVADDLSLNYSTARVEIKYLADNGLIAGVANQYRLPSPKVHQARKYIQD